jgi:hypothetical protein
MKKPKIIIALVAIILIVVVSFLFFKNKNKNKTSKKQINVNQKIDTSTPRNPEDVSYLSGLPCENKKRRAMAVMIEADAPARPMAGFSQADMMFEMPAVYGSITRLMAVYVCNDPEEVGSIRSARHDFVHLAKGIDAIYAHWGRADIEQFKGILDEGIIDNMNCNNDAGKSAGQYCFRKEGMSRGVDTGYAKFATLIEGAKKFGYNLENKFVGYPHKDDAPIDQRPSGGHLRVAFAKPYDVEYDYDKATNSWLRTWGDTADTDRNNKQRVAPKNVVVMIADAAPIKVGEQYVNVQIGDPWYDQNDSGVAFFYMDGKQYKGTWKKDKSKVDSKLFFYDESGQEVEFVPGQIWVEIIDPGQALKWVPTN